MNDPNETEQEQTEQTEQATEQTTAEPAQSEMIPKARLDEVITDRNTLREQMAAAQQAIYESNLRIQRMEAEAEAAKKFAANAPSTQALTPEAQQRKAAQDALRGMISESVGPLFDQKLGAIANVLGPVQELVEESQRAKFWSDSKNTKLPDKLKNMAETAYTAYKRQIPGLTREMALQFAKGAFFDEQIAAQSSSTETTKAKVNTVNKIAAAAPQGSGSGASGQVAPAKKEKSAADLSAELYELAQNGYKT